MTPDLAILIPTMNSREKLCQRLENALKKQIGNSDRVIILKSVDDGEATTGFKRNLLLDYARSAGVKYVAFFDDDDLPGRQYIQKQLEVCDSGLDCGELYGRIYFSGRIGKPFHHSIVYDHWWENDMAYFRNPNHLNCIKLTALDGIRFQDKTVGEDGHFSIDLQKSGVLKTMHGINDVIYHYFTGQKNTETELNYAKSLGV